MRATDSVIALPLLPLLIVLAAVDLRKLGFSNELANSEDASLYRIIIIVSVVGWTTVARLVRAETLSMKRRDFVRAAVALGARTDRILLLHILPNVISPIVVATTLSVGNIILFESVLSFLGLGLQLPVSLTNLLLLVLLLALDLSGPLLRLLLISARSSAFPPIFALKAWWRCW